MWAIHCGLCGRKKGRIERRGSGTRTVGEGELSFAGLTSVLTPQKWWESLREGGTHMGDGGEGVRGESSGGLSCF